MAEVATTRSPNSGTAASYVTKDPSAAGAVAAALSTTASALGGRVGNASAYTASAFEDPLRTTFLGAFTVVAFVGNLLLILAIAQSRTLRTTTINVHLMGMAVANFIFCAVDMPLMIASSVANEWQYGETACSIFSFLHLVSSVEYVLGILCLSVDRLAVAKRWPRGSRSSGGGGPEPDGFAWAVAIVIGCWLVAASSGVPLLTDSVSSVWYPNSYTCDIGVGNSASIVYSAVIYSCLFTLPPVLTVVLLMVTASMALRDRDDTPIRGRAAPRTLFRTADEDAESPQPSRGAGVGDSAPSEDPRGARGAVFVLLLFVLWIIFVAPHTALASVALYSQSVSDIGLSSQSSHILNVVFMWLVCAHNMVLPFAAFMWRRDIWHHFKDVLAWHKSTTAVGVASTASVAPSLQPAGGRQPVQQPQERFPARFKVPVLVATETGLHVHDDDNNNAAADGDWRDVVVAPNGPTPYDDRDVFYADLTTRSNEVTVERSSNEVTAKRSSSGGGSGVGAVAGAGQASKPFGYAYGEPLSLPDVTDRRSKFQPTGVGSAPYGWPSEEVDAAIGQANSLSTDSGVGSAAGSGGRKSKKHTKAGARGALLVRTGSQPPISPEQGGGGEPLPRMLLSAVSLGQWLPPAQVHDRGSPANGPLSSRNGAGAASAIGFRAIDAQEPTAHHPQLSWAARDEVPASDASRKRRRKKKRAERTEVVSLPAGAALASHGGAVDIDLPPLRPARLAPISLVSSMPIAAVARDAAVYGSPQAGLGRRGTRHVEDGF